VVLPRVERLFAVNWSVSKSKYVVTPTVAAEELAVAISKKLLKYKLTSSKLKTGPTSPI
jgi:hypothetical protein